MDFRAKIAKVYFVIVTCTILSTVCAENEKVDFKGNGLLFDRLLNRIEKLEARDGVRENENKELKERVVYLESLTQQQQVKLMNMKEAATDQHALNEELQDRLQFLESRDKIREATETDLKNQKKRLQLLETFIRRLTRRLSINRDDQAGPKRDIPEQAVRGTEKKDVAIQRIKKRENEMTVAFFAYLNNHIQSPGVHQIIAFDHVTTNLGNGYNQHAGDFRAPVAGTYVFATTLMAGIETIVYHFQIMHNSNTVSSLYITNGGTVSQEVVLQLKQGDDVSIHNIDSGKKIYGAGYSTFSGFLLQQDFSSPPVVGK